ncbi:MAG: AarF/ABC1/UbiB kinase family protein [Desulfobacterales bacterium]|nr:AarF/ABC1/UbiB kinase family protein [Desulfobacterales bacterium]
MGAEIPTGKLKRSLTGGKTAVKVGGKVLKYLASKPFLSKGHQRRAKTALNEESADIIFKGLCLLRGTALKIAQQLSLEVEIFPEAVRKELEKSYHQAPPINRALVRKIIQNEFGESPEAVFQSFETNAFAAASLGQVHRAASKNGEKLAVKVQYPGIDETIKNDIQLIKGILRPLPEYALMLPAMEEIEARLLEEIDYRREARNIGFFAENLKLEGLRIPTAFDDARGKTVLSMSFMPGPPLDDWLKTNPDQASRDAVAQKLHDIFLESLYGLHRIHADPNPGNFLIDEDLTLSLIDFGCVKRLDEDFVRLYQRLPKVIAQGSRKRYFTLMKELNVVDSSLDPGIEERMYKVMFRFSQWFTRLYQEDVFDFNANENYFAEGKALFNDMYQFRKHVDMNPNFVFLDRTRYGLVRLFARMRARVRFRNEYEA